MITYDDDDRDRMRGREAASQVQAGVGRPSHDLEPGILDFGVSEDTPFLHNERERRRVVDCIGGMENW